MSTMTPIRPQAPADAPPRRRRARSVAAAVVLVVGLLVAATWTVAGTLASLRDTRGFPGATIPGRVTVSLTAGEEAVVFSQGPGIPSPKALGLQVRAPSAHPVRVDAYPRELKYDAGGRLYTAVATFEAAVGGRYVVSVAGRPVAGTRFTVGRDFAGEVLWRLAAAGGIALVAVAAAVALMVSGRR